MKKKKKIKNILFVCTGNTCRSVMAEGLLRKMLKDKKKDDIQISSAGILAIDGFSPTDKTIEVMKKEGIDISGYETNKLTKKIIEEADLVLAMENIHKDEVLSLVPQAKEKTHLLRKYANKKNDPSYLDIQDPMGRPLEIYERILSTIKDSIKELVKEL